MSGGHSAGHPITTAWLGAISQTPRSDLATPTNLPGTTILGTQTPPAAVRLEAVVKRFGDDDVGRRVAKFVATDGTLPVTAVDGIDLDIRDGEFFSMLGPSGSGKTTTLRMIAGFELPTEGRILLHGVDVTNVPPIDRDVNTVFQDYALFPHMTLATTRATGCSFARSPGRSVPSGCGTLCGWFGSRDTRDAGRASAPAAVAGART